MTLVSWGRQHMGTDIRTETVTGIARTATALVSVLALVTLTGCPGKQSEKTGEPSAKYSVTISVVSELSEIGALQFDIDYSGNGGFVGRNDGVECESLLADVLSAFTSRTAAKMTGAIVDVKGFSTPRAVAKCNVESSGAPPASSFKVTVTDASDIRTTPINPYPELTVSEVSPVG